MSDDLKTDYEMLLQFMHMAPVGLLQMEVNGHIVMINPLSAQLLLPLTPNSDLTNLFQTLKYTAPELQNLCANFKKKRGQICDGLRVRSSAGILGKEKAKYLAFTLLKLDVDRIMAVITDVSLLVEREQQLQLNTEAIIRASFKDHLTGIPNRRAFFEFAEAEFERWRKRPRPLSLLAIDADYFKKVNDTYGHATGDEVLKHLSRILQDNMRNMDVVARLGGEEFGALLPSIDLQGALKIAERIRNSIEQAVLEVDGQIIRYTVSIGVSTADDSVSGVDMLLKLADEALYMSKKSGRNCVTATTQSVT